MKIQKDYIAFDQFQRYQTFAHLIDFHRQENNQIFRVLELGANEHKDLKLFLDQDSILFTDITLTENMQNDPEFQMADGTQLPFEDQSFDFVVAADVLEHVPIESRGKFLCEAYRVAKFGVILSFPFLSQDISDAENRVNTYYKTISGEDYIWLKEHADNALPDLKVIDDILGQFGIPHFSFFHGDILAAIFTKDALIIAPATEYLKAYAIDCVFTSFLFCFMGYFNGCGNTTFVMIQGIIGGICVRLPVSWVMSKIIPVSLFKIGLATPIASFIQILLCLGFFVITQRTNLKRKNSDSKQKSV
jgi:hypothetical protein